jgi:hypothetical protein
MDYPVINSLTYASDQIQAKLRAASGMRAWLAKSNRGPISHLKRKLFSIVRTFTASQDFNFDHHRRRLRNFEFFFYNDTKTTQKSRI